MLKIRRLAPLAVVCSVALSGCGSSAHTPSRSVTPVRPRPAAGQSAADGFAMRTPLAALRSSAAALRQVAGYELDGVIRDGSHRESIHVAVDAMHSEDVQVVTGRSSFEVLRLASAAYVKGNLDYWALRVGARAAALQDRWIEVPLNNVKAELAKLDKLKPATMSRCLLEDHGTLSFAGRAIIGGQPVILVRDAGDRPGTQPGVLTIAATGGLSPLPIREEDTGPHRAGGRIDTCNDGVASKARGTLSLSRFGAVDSLHAPANALIPTAGVTE